MSRKQGDVEKGLERKGFERGNGDHNYFHYHTQTGKKTRVFTKTSHGGRELDDSLLGKMSKQCKLSRADFDRLIDCTLDRPAYEKKLVAAGHVEAQDKQGT